MQNNRTRKKYIRKTFSYQGKRYEVRGETEKEAYEKLGELKSALRHGDVGVSGNMTAAAWCREWMNSYVAPRVREAGQPKQSGTMSPNSYSTYKTYVDRYVIPGLGALKLSDVKDIHLMRILNAESGRSFGHVSRIRMILRACFAQAAASRLIPYDPSLKLTLPVNKKKSRRSITAYEREILYKVAESNRHGLWIRTLLETGMRPGETAALRVSDLDFKENVIAVNKAVEAGTKIVSTPKTEAGNRFVPIPDSLLDDLKSSVEDKAPTALVFPQISNPDLIMTKTCRKRYWQNFARDMDLAMGAEHTKQGHIYDPSDVLPDGKPVYPDPEDKSKPRNGHRIAPDLVPYCLRHTYCTDLQRAGVPLNVARYLMGHSDISVTAQIYTHSDKEEALNARELINSYKAKEKEKAEG